MSEINFSFIFVNYRSADLLGGALPLLLSAVKDISYEIIVVNNDLCEREQLDELEKKFLIQVEHLHANYGFGKANNVGAELARGEILVFLNPDTRYRSGKFESLREALAFHQNGVFGLRLEDEHGRGEVWSCGPAPRVWRMIARKTFPVFFTRQKPWQSEFAQATDWVSGAALSMHRKTFQALGGFDESFFLYYEDVDLCMRAREKGLPVFTYPFLRWYHLRGKSHISYQAMKKSYFEGQQRYFKKHGTWIEKKLLLILQPLRRLLLV